MPWTYKCRPVSASSTRFPMTPAASHAIAGTTNDLAEEIQPQYNLRFERVAAGPGRGFCLVDVLLRNNGLIPANFPFFCLTVLGPVSYTHLTLPTSELV